MNWIFEIYGDTYKALTLQNGRRKPSLEDGRVKPGHDALGGSSCADLIRASAGLGAQDAATAAISTESFGSAKPVTIRRVEAGFAPSSIRSRTCR